METKKQPTTDIYRPRGHLNRLEGIIKGKPQPLQIKVISWRSIL